MVKSRLLPELLAALAALMVFGEPFPNSPPPSAFVAVLFGLSAMGAQSALVRLLLRGVASTNVMTTNTTQIAIDATQAACASWQNTTGGFRNNLIVVALTTDTQSQTGETDVIFGDDLPSALSDAEGRRIKTHVINPPGASR